MPKLIKDQAVIDDQWQVLATDDTEIPSGPAIIPLKLWLENKQSLTGRGSLGVWLNSDESPKSIMDSLDQFQVIAINFPAFADGRGFSYARELRQQHSFKGEIRALGDFMRDQLFFLQRCGFDAFSLEGADPEQALASLNDFSDSYQAATDQPEPLFKRR